MSSGTFALGQRARRRLRELLQSAKINLQTQYIQGNVLGGFNKKFEKIVRCEITNPREFRNWIRSNAKLITSAQETIKSKLLYKSFGFTQGKGASQKGGSWVNMVFSRNACRMIGLEASFDGRLEEQLFGHDLGFALLLLASDSREFLERDSAELVSSIRGARVITVDEGMKRSGDNAGKEHFGFRDGISQPRIYGVDDIYSDNDSAPENRWGQLLLPGDFVCGYPRDHATVSNGPKNCSYMVYWKLRQNIRLFNDFLSYEAERLRDITKDNGWTAARVAALIMGRDFSGKVTSDSSVNNALGCPVAAHVYKANPQLIFGGDDNSWARNLRIIRRGMPYGSDGDSDVGLLFVCYQASIENQFEEILEKWMSDANVPFFGAGTDLFVGGIIPKSRECFVAVPILTNEGESLVVRICLPKKFIEPCYGGYFFVPAINLLLSI